MKRHEEKWRENLRNRVQIFSRSGRTLRASYRDARTHLKRRTRHNFILLTTPNKSRHTTTTQLHAIENGYWRSKNNLNSSKHLINDKLTYQPTALPYLWSLPTDIGRVSSHRQSNRVFYGPPGRLLRSIARSVHGLAHCLVRQWNLRKCVHVVNTFNGNKRVFNVH